MLLNILIQYIRKIRKSLNKYVLNKYHQLLNYNSIKLNEIVNSFSLLVIFLSIPSELSKNPALQSKHA